jgi:hypothetical protein
MKIEHTSIAVATLLTQLLVRIQKDRVLTPEALDAVMRETISLNGEHADNEANLDATRFLQEVWAALKDDRH